MKALERIVKFYPAYDKRHEDPAKNYGIHGVELRMLVKGDRGAVQFVLYTNWMLPHVTKELTNKSQDTGLFKPLPADLGYHSLTPIYKGQKSSGKCEYLDGKKCYYDGSGLNAERIYTTLLSHGSDGVWKALEEYYSEVFA